MHVQYGGSATVKTENTGTKLSLKIACNGKYTERFLKSELMWAFSGIFLTSAHENENERREAWGWKTRSFEHRGDRSRADLRLIYREYVLVREFFSTPVVTISMSSLKRSSNISTTFLESLDIIVRLTYHEQYLFRTAVPCWGQSNHIPSNLFPKWDCGPQLVYTCKTELEIRHIYNLPGYISKTKNCILASVCSDGTPQYARVGLNVCADRCWQCQAGLASANK